jgi:hypothetical protein
MRNNLSLVIALLVLSFPAFIPAQDEQPQQQEALPPDAILAPADYTPLEIVGWFPFNQPPANLPNMIRMAALSDGSIVLINQQPGEVVRIDLQGNVLARWSGGGTGDSEFKHPQAVGVAPNDDIYVCEGGAAKVLIFKPDGTFVDTFKDYLGIINFTFSPAGDIYCAPYILQFTPDMEPARLWVFSPLGELKKSFPFPANTEYPELNKGLTMIPAVIDGKVYMASGMYPEIQVFDLDGALVDEFELDDPRFVLRAESNRAKADQPMPRGPMKDTSILGGGMSRRIAVLDGNLVFNVHLDAPGVELLTVNPQTKTASSYYLAVQETISILDLAIINQPDGPLFACLKAGAERGVLILKPMGK